ncbi:hypothetical protein [Nocardioides sp. S5]|uniref:hypothetical protein n=1 Tax=Nocardioides sp. S5 TaxID=2017486 RepID=UPI001A8DAFA2|nr:hypothetical protein [Nocardioides sp. S5]
MSGDKTHDVRSRGGPANGPARLPRPVPHAAQLRRQPYVRAGRADRLGAGRRDVGGLGLAPVHAVTDDRGRDHDRGAWVERRGDDGPGDRGMHRGPRGVPGQLPPTTAPDDDSSSS